MDAAKRLREVSGRGFFQLFFEKEQAQHVEIQREEKFLKKRGRWCCGEREKVYFCSPVLRTWRTVREGEDALGRRRGEGQGGQCSLNEWKDVANNSSCS